MKYSLNFNNHWLISWALSFIECFYHLSPGHSQGSWSVVLIRYYGPVVSDQLFSSLFIHSQLDAVSAACPSLPTSLFLSPALIPSLPSVLHNDWAGNPLLLISTGNSQVLKLLWFSVLGHRPFICFITSCLPRDLKVQLCRLFGLKNPPLLDVFCTSQETCWFTFINCLKFITLF